MKDAVNNDKNDNDLEVHTPTNHKTKGLHSSVFTLQDEVQTLETAEITNTNRDDAEVFSIILIRIFW